MPGEAVGDLTRTTRKHLERPWVRRKLIIDLAKGNKTQQALADEYQVVQQSISEFAKRHLHDIENVRADLENEFAGLWVAEKANRLAAMQDDVEWVRERLRSDEFVQAMEDYVAAAHDEDERKVRAEEIVRIANADPAYMRLSMQLLRAVAEEMGQIPNKVSLRVDGQVVNYIVEGIDTEQV